MLEGAVDAGRVGKDLDSCDEGLVLLISSGLASVS